MTSPSDAPVSTDPESIPYRDMPPETDWRLDAANINKLQQASIEGLVRRCKQAHWVDIVIRINGKYEVYQADWIKHLEPK